MHHQHLDLLLDVEWHLIMLGWVLWQGRRGVLQEQTLPDGKFESASDASLEGREQP
jgi:hypothetical protein